MSAHEVVGNGRPAHDSKPPLGSTSRMTFLNIDKTGLSMSPKTIVALVTFIIFLVSGWFAFLMVNATKADLKTELTTHNASAQAHPIIVDKDSKPVGLPVVVKQQNETLKVVKENRKVILTVKNGFHEDRSERLADRAADKVRDPKESLERWKKVKRKAMQNLKDEKPLRDGLEDYL